MPEEFPKFSWAVNARKAPKNEEENLRLIKILRKVFDCDIEKLTFDQKITFIQNTLFHKYKIESLSIDEKSPRLLDVAACILPESSVVAIAEKIHSVLQSLRGRLTKHQQKLLQSNQWARKIAETFAA